jgi:proline utilization trans-activator
LSHACGIFSRKACILLYQLIVSGQFDGMAWLDAYYIYHSVFILSLDFLARPWDDQDTQEDEARKKAVRDVMTALQNVKLCRTFTILTQVSLQLAKIVGIFEVHSEKHEKPEEFRQYMEQQQATFTFDYGTQGSQLGVENVVNNWFQKEPVDLPWDMKDFFGADGFVGPQTEVPGLGSSFGSMPLTLGGTYNNHLPGISEDGLSSPVPPHTAYTQWGHIDTPFVQNRGGSASRGPGGINQ